MIDCGLGHFHSDRASREQSAEVGCSTFRRNSLFSPSPTLTFLFFDFQLPGPPSMFHHTLVAPSYPYSSIAATSLVAYRGGSSHGRSKSPGQIATPPVKATRTLFRPYSTLAGLFCQSGKSFPPSSMLTFSSVFLAPPPSSRSHPPLIILSRVRRLRYTRTTFRLYSVLASFFP